MRGWNTCPLGNCGLEETDPATSYIPFRFTSKEYDEETGLYYYGARYYEPRLSRWMSADPGGWELVDPDKNEHLLISGLNWYSYTENNPIKYDDPSGGIPTVVIGAAVGGAVGAVAGVVSAVAQGNTSFREIAGGAVGGAISGTVTGALIGSGVGIPLVAGGSVVGGSVGSLAENSIAKGVENLDAKTVAKDAVIDGVFSGLGSILGIGAGKNFKSATKFSVVFKKILELGLGTVIDIGQDNVNPPSSSNSDGEGMDEGSTGSDSAQDNANPRQSDRKIPEVSSIPQSSWSHNYSNDD